MSVLWTTFVFIAVVFITFVGAIIWLQTPSAHRMAAAMIFEAESFDDPDRDTMHWNTLTGFFPFRFQVYDVRWLRAQGQCTDQMNVTVIGGEKRCVTVFVPKIKAQLNPWKIITEQRMVINDIQIPHMVINRDALIQPTETTKTQRHKTDIDPERTIWSDPARSDRVEQTLETPPWFTLHGTTKFDFYDIAHVRISDSATIARMMNDMHRVHRVVPQMPDVLDTIMDDFTVHGKSTIMGAGGSWDVVAHIRSLKDQDGFRRQHADVKLYGDHVLQTVQLDASFRTTDVGNGQGAAEGTLKAKGTWRALNMLMQPNEALGHSPDGDSPLWMESSVKTNQFRSEARIKVGPQRTVHVDHFKAQHPKGTVEVSGVMGSADRYSHWPETVNVKIYNVSQGLVESSDTLYAECVQTHCLIDTVARGGDYSVFVDVKAMKRGLRLAIRNADQWSVATHTLPSVLADTVVTFKPSDCKPGTESKFFTTGKNLYALYQQNDQWCVSVENSYGTGSVLLNSTARSIDHLEADMQITHLEMQNIAVQYLRIHAQDHTVLLDAQNIEYGAVNVDSVRLQGKSPKPLQEPDGSWNLFAKGIRYGERDPIVVMATGNARYEQGDVSVHSDYGYMSTDAAHVEWKQDGLDALYGWVTGKSSLRFNALFGPTGHFRLESDATLKTYSLNDFNYYSIDVADDAHTLFALLPSFVTEYLPNGTSTHGTMRVKAWGQNGELPQAILTLDNGTFVVPNHATIYGTYAKITVPDGTYDVYGTYQSQNAQAQFDSSGWFAWRRGAARFTSDSYYVSDMGTETEFTGELTWKPGTLPVPHI